MRLFLYQILAWKNAYEKYSKLLLHALAHMQKLVQYTLRSVYYTKTTNLDSLTKRPHQSMVNLLMYLLFSAHCCILLWIRIGYSCFVSIKILINNFKICLYSLLIHLKMMEIAIETL